MADDRRLYYLRKPVEIVRECADLVERWGSDPLTLDLVAYALRRSADAMEAGNDEIEPY